MRLRPCRRILAPKDKRKMVYAITVSEALRLEIVSIWLTVLADWLTNPPRSSQIGPRPRRGVPDFHRLLGADTMLLIRSLDERRFIPQDPSLQPFVETRPVCMIRPHGTQWHRLQPVGVRLCMD